MPRLKTSTFTAFLALAVLLPSVVLADGHGSENIDNIIEDGKFFGDLRYRYEMVDQDGFTEDARASTIRTNIGFKTGSFKGFKGLGEVQIVENIGANDFNDTVNGNTAYPVVADPDVAEINRFWLEYQGIPDTHIKLGRQFINLDNQRFVGTVGWRQNDQTFDAVRLTNKTIDGLELDYNYVQNVNRIFGDDANLGDLSSKVHLARASYKFTDWLNATAYGYWMDFDRAAALSNKTYGARLTGKTKITDDWTFSYEAEVAAQSEHGANTTDYSETYYHIAPSIKGHGLALKAGYEELGGNGTNGFITPLATLHKFNGWADAFLNTPASGLEDFYFSAAYKVSGTSTPLDGLNFKAVYHDYDSHTGGSDLGDELNLALSKSFALSGADEGYPFDKVNVALKYADYDGDGGVASREKIWLQVGVKF